MTPFQRHLKEALYLTDQVKIDIQTPETPERQTTAPPSGGDPSPNPNVRPGGYLPGGPPWIWKDPDGSLVDPDGNPVDQDGNPIDPNPEPDPDEDPFDEFRDPDELDQWQKGYNEYFTYEILQWLKGDGDRPGRTIEDIIDTIDANYPRKPMWRFR